MLGHCPECVGSQQGKQHMKHKCAVRIAHYLQVHAMRLNGLTLV